MLIADKVLKLADFGSCRGIYSKQPYTEYISTRWYRAPECLLTDGYYGYKMDMWGAGCVMFEALALYPLFPGGNEADQIERIHKIMGTPSPELLDKFKVYGSSHVNFNFTQYKRHPAGFAKYLPHVSTEAIDLLTKLLAYDPDERPTAREALKHAWFQECRAEERRQREEEKGKDKEKEGGVVDTEKNKAALEDPAAVAVDSDPSQGSKSTSSRSTGKVSLNATGSRGASEPANSTSSFSSPAKQSTTSSASADLSPVPQVVEEMLDQGSPSIAKSGALREDPLRKTGTSVTQDPSAASSAAKDPSSLSSVHSSVNTGSTTSLGASSSTSSFASPGKLYVSPNMASPTAALFNGANPPPNLIVSPTPAAISSMLASIGSASTAAASAATNAGFSAAVSAKNKADPVAQSNVQSRSTSQTYTNAARDTDTDASAKQSGGSSTSAVANKAVANKNSFSSAKENAGSNTGIQSRSTARESIPAAAKRAGGVRAGAGGDSNTSGAGGGGTRSSSQSSNHADAKGRQASKTTRTEGTSANASTLQNRKFGAPAGGIGGINAANANARRLPSPSPLAKGQRAPRRNQSLPSSNVTQSSNNSPQSQDKESFPEKMFASPGLANKGTGALPSSSSLLHHHQSSGPVPSGAGRTQQQSFPWGSPTTTGPFSSSGSGVMVMGYPKGNREVSRSLGPDSTPTQSRFPQMHFSPGGSLPVLRNSQAHPSGYSGYNQNINSSLSVGANQLRTLYTGSYMPLSNMQGKGHPAAQRNTGYAKNPIKNAGSIQIQSPPSLGLVSGRVQPKRTMTQLDAPSLGPQPGVGAYPNSSFRSPAVGRHDGYNQFLSPNAHAGPRQMHRGVPASLITQPRYASPSPAAHGYGYPPIRDVSPHNSMHGMHSMNQNSGVYPEASVQSMAGSPIRTIGGPNSNIYGVSALHSSALGPSTNPNALLYPGRHDNAPSFGSPGPMGSLGPQKSSVLSPPVRGPIRNAAYPQTGGYPASGNYAIGAGAGAGVNPGRVYRGPPPRQVQNPAASISSSFGGISGDSVSNQTQYNSRPGATANTKTSGASNKYTGSTQRAGKYNSQMAPPITSRNMQGRHGKQDLTAATGAAARVRAGENFIRSHAVRK